MKIKIRGWLYDTVTGAWAKGKLKALPKPVPKGMYILNYLDMLKEATDKLDQALIEAGVFDYITDFHLESTFYLDRLARGMVNRLERAGKKPLLPFYDIGAHYCPWCGFRTTPTGVGNTNYCWRCTYYSVVEKNNFVRSRS